jgi:hypothetical protein
MTKAAHIISRPGAAVGDRALALCGKDFKVKVLWEDLPREKPICRDCVDVALDAMTEADSIIGRARVEVMLIERRVAGIAETLNPPDLVLDVIAENEDEYRMAERQRQEAEADADRKQHTCTCRWNPGNDEAPDWADPDCPIHVEWVNDPPVAPTE